MRPLTDEIIAAAQRAENVYDVPSAMNIAAAMEESGLGEHIPPGSNNWHGIKGGGPATSTREQSAGGVWYTIKSGFHMFKAWPDSFMYYAWLISHGSPYAVAWKCYLASDRGSGAVERLTKDIAAKYATALKYATDLIALEEKDRLFRYDEKGPQMTADAPPMKTAMPVAAMAAEPARTSPLTSAEPKPDLPSTPIVPPIGGTVKIDVGDFAETLIGYAKTFVEAAVAAGEPIALANIPLGSLIGSFITPQVINGYIDQAATAADKVVAGASVTLEANSVMATIATDLFQKGQPYLVDFLGKEVEPMIVKAIAALKKV